MVNVLKAGEVLKAGVSKLVKIEDGEKMQIYSPSGDQIGIHYTGQVMVKRVGRFNLYMFFLYISGGFIIFLRVNYFNFCNICSPIKIHGEEADTFF